jgi:hypothetical protein
MLSGRRTRWQLGFHYSGSDIADKSRHQIESQMDSVPQRIVDRRRCP